MSRTGSLVVLAIFAFFLTHCTPSTSQTDGCATNQDCPSGYVCKADGCAKVCGQNADCPEGNVCTPQGTCGTVEGGLPPRITNINGNGSDLDDIVDGVVLSGEGLGDVEVSLLTPGQGAQVLAIRSQAVEQVEAILPQDIRSGDYTFKVSNQAGSDESAVALQLPEITGGMILERLNQRLRDDGAKAVERASSLDCDNCLSGVEIAANAVKQRHIELPLNLGGVTLSDADGGSVSAGNVQADAAGLESLNINGALTWNQDPLEQMPIKTEGLMGFWTFQDGTATDHSGNANHGAILDATPDNDDGDTPPRLLAHRWRRALWFDGVDDYVEVPSSGSVDVTGPALTLEAWIMISEDTGNAFLNKENQYELQVDEGELQAAVDTETEGSEWSWIPSGWNVPVGEWVHIALTYSGDSSTLQFFGNGRLEAEAANNSGNTGNIAPEEHALRFAARGAGEPSGFVKVAIDEVRVWDRILSEQELLQLAASPIGP